jgi:CheY-like chemotaxis protein
MERCHAPNPPVRPLVLIVEGNEDARALHALGLSAMGFNVVPIADGTEAFPRAWEIHPDIIVLDHPLPNAEDRHLLDTLQEHPRTRDIPVVAVGPYIQVDELAAGLRQVLDGIAHAHVER